MRHTRTAFAGLLASTFLVGAAFADSHATHPTTGEALASDQTFTYRVLDDFPSIDPQVLEDVEGSAVARDLFEGLMGQDADGNLVPAVATGFTTNDIIAGEKPIEELGVTAIDDTTLEVRLSTSLSYFPQMVTQSTTFPVPQAVVEAHGSDWTKPENIVGNGAYILTEYVPGEKLVRDPGS